MNADEGYSFFSDFGLVHDDSRKRSQVGAQAAANAHAGALNRYLQFGESARATQTSGCYGGASTPMTSMGFNANMHPEVAIPLDRGLIGNHVGATKERILFYCAPRVQPHECLPERFQVPNGVEAWIWVEFDEDLAALSGYSDLLRDPELAAARNLPRACQNETDILSDGVFLPDAEGYVIDLADGVSTRLRWRVSQPMHVPEIRIANRNIPLDAKFQLRPACERVLRQFGTQGQVIARSAEAMLKAKAFETYYSVQAAVASDAGHDAAAARWGIASWHCGVLSGLLLGFDIAVGQYSPGEYTPVEVSCIHVQRAKKLLDLLIGMRDCWANTVSPSTVLPAGAAVAPASLLREPPDFYRPPASMGHFPATQPEGEGTPSSAMSPPGRAAFQWDLAGTEKAPPKAAAQGIAMDVGYGPDFF